LRVGNKDTCATDDPYKILNLDHKCIMASRGAKRKNSSVEKNEIPQKVSKYPNNLSLINSALLTSESRLQLKAKHDNSKPYTHLVLPKLCDDKYLKTVHDEITSTLNATLKETDLYKLYQTAEIGRIKNDNTNNRKKLKNLLDLRDQLYTSEFRKFIEDITGCPTLNDTVDCACNAYSQTCHLLCHDDVIGSRCVAYIIYLTDPDSEWTASDGGALELYPVTPSGNNTVEISSVPSTTIIPLFNHMSLFIVQPGVSYHSVQEVFTDSRPRISIGGWFHSDVKDNSITTVPAIYRPTTVPVSIIPYKAEIEKLPASNNANSKQKKGKNGVKTALLTAQSREYLSMFINNDYLSDNAISAINKEFIDNSTVRLTDFLKKHIADKVEELSKYQDAADELGAGRAPRSYYVGVDTSNNSNKSSKHMKTTKAKIEKGKNKNFDSNSCSSSTSVTDAAWTVVGPPQECRYLKYSKDCVDSTPVTSSVISEFIQNVTDIGELLNFLNFHLFQHSIFASYYLKLLTELQCTSILPEIRRFRPGLDYTLAHAGAVTTDSKLDCTMCFAYEPVQDDCSVASSVKSDDGSEEDSDEEEGMEEFGQTVGGYECYIEVSPDSDAYDSYSAPTTSAVTAEKPSHNRNKGSADDTDSELQRLPSASNVLSLVLRDSGVVRFIKYLNCQAVSSRWDISVVYDVDA
jgi:Rps23 Pro-64 3,4-dihydroxylase Tpa1-like proline 4-hydroxylase